MIKITNTNAAKIEAMLAAVNGRATEHTYLCGDLADLAISAEERLESLGIPKSMRAGAEVFAISGGAVPNAYKYSRKATSARLVRRATGWFVANVGSVTIWERGGKVDLMLTEDQDAKAIETLRTGYRIQRPVVAIAA